MVEQKVGTEYRGLNDNWNWILKIKFWFHLNLFIKNVYISMLSLKPKNSSSNFETKIFSLNYTKSEIRSGFQNLCLFRQPIQELWSSDENPF